MEYRKPIDCVYFVDLVVLINEIAMSFHLNSNQIERRCIEPYTTAATVHRLLLTIPLLCTYSFAKREKCKYTLVSYSHCIQQSKRTKRSGKRITVSSFWIHFEFVFFSKKNVCLAASVDFHLPLRIKNFNRTTEHNAEHVAHCRLAYLVHNRKENMSDVMGERITNSVMYGKQVTKPASAQRANKTSKQRYHWLMVASLLRCLVLIRAQCWMNADNAIKYVINVRYYLV